MWELVALLISYVSTALNYSIVRRWSRKLNMSSWKWFWNDLVSLACFTSVPVFGFESHESLKILSIVMRVWKYSWELWEFGNIIESHENSKTLSTVKRVWKNLESCESLEIFLRVMIVWKFSQWASLIPRLEEREHWWWACSDVFFNLTFNKYKGLSSVNTQNKSACFMSALDHAMRLRYKNLAQNAILETPEGDWKVAVLFRVETATFNLVRTFILSEPASSVSIGSNQGPRWWLRERTRDVNLIFWEQLLSNICICFKACLQVFLKARKCFYRHVLKNFGYLFELLVSTHKSLKILDGAGTLQKKSCDGFALKTSIWKVQCIELSCQNFNVKSSMHWSFISKLQCQKFNALKF